MNSVWIGYIEEGNSGKSRQMKFTLREETNE